MFAALKVYFLQMDTIDAPFYSAVTKKQRAELRPTSLQQELRHKMRQRKKQGLAADVTSEESEGLDDGLDSEEENSMYQFVLLKPYKLKYNKKKF